MNINGAGKESGPLLSRAQSRLLDRLAIERVGMSGLVLMENAGRGLSDVLCRLAGCFAPSETSPSCPKDKEAALPAGLAALEQTLFDRRRLQGNHRDYGGPVVICCGRGNNAGDGLVMARHLWLRGHEVKVFLWSKPEELSPDAAANYSILQRAGFPIECFPGGNNGDRLAAALADACWVVDALLGTGARGQPRPPIDEVIRQLNAAGKPILAVDLPSGLDCDTGLPTDPTIRAAITCTFAAAKPGLVHPEAQEYVGQLVVLDIGIPPPLLEEVLAYSPPELPTP